jgi:L-lactate dehydrogenase
MRVGIIGVGAVGSACALALVRRGAAREVVLVDRTCERTGAVATHLRYGTPLSPLVDIGDGDFNNLAGAALIMVTAGVNEKDRARYRPQGCRGPVEASRHQSRHL